VLELQFDRYLNIYILSFSWLRNHLLKGNSSDKLKNEGPSIVDGWLLGFCLG
jgi:hypothetical protein